jgi:hypothetical protein
MRSWGPYAHLGDVLAPCRACATCVLVPPPSNRPVPMRWCTGRPARTRVQSMHPSSRANRLGVHLLWLTAQFGCRGPETVGIASSPRHATPPERADASFESSVWDAQPEMESKPASPESGDDSQTSCGRQRTKATGILLEVDSPVWGVRGLFLSTSGEFRYRSGYAGENPYVFGLPDEQCDSQVRPEEVSALFDQLTTSGFCNAPPQSEDALPASARTITVCMSPFRSRCSWSAVLVNPPAWMKTVTRFVRSACGRAGATHPSPGD